MEDNQLLSEQLAYYQARAAEYDEWFLRQGRYDRGPEHRAAWFREVAVVEAALDRELQPGEVLELACGTGLWTQHLVRWHARVVAIDASPEAIAINQHRVQSAAVEYVVDDLFRWEPESRFDAVFFGFWLSHVPPNQFEKFWAKVGRSLKPLGQVFFVDSLFEQAATARDHAPLDQSGVIQRRLNDGREFRIVKIFYEPANLERRLSTLGWHGWIRSSGQFFLYGSLARTAR
jgi:demethylmenaquinone methyltransferase/2-methoxy-6-polyprenyl-1,4-benzoquinol methylase